MPAQQFNIQVLLNQSAAVRTNVTDFGQFYDRCVQALLSYKKAVDVMVNNGKSVLADADSFALKQENEYAALLRNNALQDQLDSKVHKYILVNRIKALAYTIIQQEKQERLFIGRRNYQKMQLEMTELTTLYKLQKITRDKVELNKIRVARTVTGKYTQAAAVWIKTR